MSNHRAAIATPGRRPQEFTIGAERLANCRYVKLKCIVLDNRARPYATREIVLGDELAGRANQTFDDVECATADRDGSSTGPQFTASKIDLPLTRLVHQSSALRRHIAAPSQDISGLLRSWPANNRTSANRPPGPVPVSPFLRTIQLGSSRTLGRSAYLASE